MVRSKAVLEIKGSGALGAVLVALLLASLAALILWRTWEGLAQVDRMMAERSATLCGTVATGVRNVARFGRERRERVDDVLADVVANRDVLGACLEQLDGPIQVTHGELPDPLVQIESVEAAPQLIGRRLLRARSFPVDTQDCGHCRGCDIGCSIGGAEGFDGNYRVLLVIDGEPYLELKRSVWFQAAAGALLLLFLVTTLWLLQRRVRRESSFREALAISEERGRSLERLGLVASGLAHEIKNPVGSLRGFAQLIAERADPDSPEAEYSGLMIGELDNITRRMDRLRDLARTAPPDLKPGDPVEVVERLLSLLKPDLAARSLTVDFERPETALNDAIIDADRLRDLVFNLLTNAIEASPRESSVDVRLRLNERTGMIILEVMDRGPGIPAAERERVLRPFHSTKDGGMGLGLTVAQRAVEDHGGMLEIMEGPEGGGMIRATWPMSASRAQGG